MKVIHILRNGQQVETVRGRRLDEKTKKQVIKIMEEMEVKNEKKTI